MKNFIKTRLEKNKYSPTIYSLRDNFYLLLNFFFSRTPTRCKAGPLSCNPFFIIGSGRSGHTLLRAILFSHNDIAIPPESYVLGPLAKKYQSINYLDWESLSRIIISEFERHRQFYTWEINLTGLYQKISNLPKEKQGLDQAIDLIYTYYIQQKKPEAKRWGDKTPVNTLNLWWINQIFPQAQHIHVIRDGRDVVNSMLNAGFYKNVYQAAWRWKTGVELAQNFGSQLEKGRYMEVRYEDLVRKPKQEIKKVCTFLNISYSEKMLKFFEKFDQLGDAPRLEVLKNLKKPMTTKSVGRWKKELKKNDRELVNRLLSKTLNGLGYY